LATIAIRPEAPGDRAALRGVNERAFGQSAEADLVDALRAGCPDRLSLVAELEGEVVGHILFSPATLEGEGDTLVGMALAPMAVLPEHQRRGIGSRLVEAGLAELRQADCPFVIVLGHPDYYPRFGFVPASRHGVRGEYVVPDEVFMLLPLAANPDRLAGLARYRPEFAAAD
jgi:putative acetyltransferase